MKNKIFALIIELLASLIGFGLLFYSTNWMVTLGVFLVIYGNNLMTGRHYAKVLGPLIKAVQLINKK